MTGVKGVLAGALRLAALVTLDVSEWFAARSDALDPDATDRLEELSPRIVLYTTDTSGVWTGTTAPTVNFLLGE